MPVPLSFRTSRNAELERKARSAKRQAQNAQGLATRVRAFLLGCAWRKDFVRICYGRLSLPMHLQACRKRFTSRAVHTQEK